MLPFIVTQSSRDAITMELAIDFTIMIHDDYSAKTIINTCARATWINIDTGDGTPE